MHRSNRLLSAFALIALSSWAPPAGAFSLYNVVGPVPNVAATLRDADRWSATPSAPSTLADGITVSVSAGFAAAMAARGGTPLEYALAILDAFAEWETPDLWFDVSFGGGPAEIQLFHVNHDDPHFQGNLFSGIAEIDSEFRSDRMLTNGQIVPGQTITAARIYIAVDRIHDVFEIFLNRGDFVEADRVARIQDNLTHEIGHVIGLGHPNEDTSFDDDGDPFTELVVADPLDPFAGITTSLLVDPNTIMRGGAPADIQAFLLTELQPDDRSGLNVLYPTVPEPAAPLVQLTALLTLCATRRFARAGASSSQRVGRSVPTT